MFIIFILKTVEKSRVFLGIWRYLQCVVISLGIDATFNLSISVPVIECCEKVIRTKTSGSGAVSTADKCFVILTYLDTSLGRISSRLQAVAVGLNIAKDGLWDWVTPESLSPSTLGIAAL